MRIPYIILYYTKPYILYYIILLGASLLILANKQDLGGALSYEAINDVLNLSGNTSIYIMTYIQCSSNTYYIVVYILYIMCYILIQYILHNTC